MPSDAMRVKFDPAARRRARRYALQALYQWTMTGQDLTAIEQQFFADNDFTQVDLPFFQAIIHQVSQHVNELEAVFIPYLDRDIEKLGCVERNALRLGSYELVKRHDIPYKVAISEAVHLVKIFGAEDSHKYVNAVLDKLAKAMRPEKKV